MIFIGIFLVIFGIIVIMAPEIIAYMIGGLIIVVGLNIIIFSTVFMHSVKKAKKDDYIKFGKYKIYR